MSRIPLPKDHQALTSLATPRKEGDTRMHEHETSFILRKCLRHEHATDPNVMKFLAEYLICRDVKQASLAAGISKRDGENIKRRPDIYEAIRQITEKAVMKYGYDAGEVVAKVKEIMDIDPGELQRPDGSFVESLGELAPETRRAIKKFKAKNVYDTDPNGMKVVVGKLLEVEFWDKMKASELLGREKDIFKETKKVVHDMAANMSSTLLESRRIAEETVAEFRDVKEEKDDSTS